MKRYIAYRRKVENVAEIYLKVKAQLANRVLFEFTNRIDLATMFYTQEDLWVAVDRINGENKEQIDTGVITVSFDW